MRVSHLALSDYRSYSDVVLEFPAGVVAFLGRNGRGKTNLIESLAYVGSLSSHRGSSPTNLVRVSPEGDQPGGAVIRARIESERRSDLLELEIARGRPNRARLNRAKVAPREIVGRLRAVVFAPEDLSLLRDQPEVRREFLDQVAVKLKPHHLGTLQEMQRVLRQRSAHLKMLQKNVGGSASDRAVLDIWNEQLAELSSEVVAHRLAVSRALTPLAERAYTAITDADRKAGLSYRSTAFGSGSDFPELSLSVEEGRFQGSADPFVGEATQAYLRMFQERRDSEIARGVNLVGAHRDDLAITLDDLPVRGFASHGEVWSTALALRLAEAELLKTESEPPVLMLDDVFAELDESRRRGLVSSIADYDQVLITVAVGGDLPEELSPSVFEVTRNSSGLSEVRPAGGRSGGKHD